MASSWKLPWPCDSIGWEISWSLTHYIFNAFANNVTWPIVLGSSKTTENHLFFGFSFFLVELNCPTLTHTGSDVFYLKHPNSSFISVCFWLDWRTPLVLGWNKCLSPISSLPQSHSIGSKGHGMFSRPSLLSLAFPPPLLHRPRPLALRNQSRQAVWDGWFLFNPSSHWPIPSRSPISSLVFTCIFFESG